MDMNNLKQIVVIKLDYHTASDFAGCKDFDAKKMVKTLVDDSFPRGSQLKKGPRKIHRKRPLLYAYT